MRTLVWTYHRSARAIVYIAVALLFSCNDAEYQLDNEFDPANLGIEPPAAFFHPGVIDTFSVGDTGSFQLYSYNITGVAGAHLNVLYGKLYGEGNSITIDSVTLDPFFVNENNECIMFWEDDRQEGILDVFLFYRPTLNTRTTSGTGSMASVHFRVESDGISELLYGESTRFVDEVNSPVTINEYGVGSIDVTNP